MTATNIGDRRRRQSRETPLSGNSLRRICSGGQTTAVGYVVGSPLFEKIINFSASPARVYTIVARLAELCGYKAQSYERHGLASKDSSAKRGGTMRWVADLARDEQRGHVDQQGESVLVVRDTNRLENDRFCDTNARATCAKSRFHAKFVSKPTFRRVRDT